MTAVTVLPAEAATFDVAVDVVIVGGGGCGLTAAIAAQQGGAASLVIERDATPSGSTGMSTGLIPGAGSQLQSAAGVADSAQLFARDVLAKAKQQTDADIVRELAEASGETIDWLVAAGVQLSLVDSFLYPGHTVHRMHGTKNRTGSELMGALSDALTRVDGDVLTEATVTSLFADADGRVAGVCCERPDGSTETVGCQALILACCGFGGNAQMVREHMPEIADAEYYGHPGNRGDALIWAHELGAAIDDLGAYQGHGGLAAGRGVPILWPVIMEGGVQVNVHGQRFSNESRGYSEQAVDVVAQPDHVAWTIFDARLDALMREFDDYRDALAANAIRSSDTIVGLASELGIDANGLMETLDEVSQAMRSGSVDRFGRVFADRPPLTAPFFGVKVTGALFHTQGGLRVDGVGRVQRPDGTAFPNLFAGGGAARGISGPSSWGYLAGNGLLTATTLGRLAGQTAAALVRP